jgi:hypothetical protein
MTINMRTTTKRPQVVVRDENTRDARLKPPKSRS